MKQYITSRQSDFKHRSDTGGLLTFQHLDSNSYSLLGFVLVYAQSLRHHDLTEATFTEGLAQGQPAEREHRRTSC